MRVVATIRRLNRLIAVLPLACVANASSSSESMLINAVQECDPNKEEFRITSNASSCGVGSHCVLNGNSSLGGYCIDDDHKSVHMDMPEALKLVCFICETMGQNDGSNRAVTSPDDKVGVFTCGELDGYGKGGSIPNTNCQIFQRMIHNNNLCGCSTVPDTYYDTAEDDEMNTPYMPSTDVSRTTDNKIDSFATTSGSRRITITITTTIATATTVSLISMLLNFF